MAGLASYWVHQHLGNLSPEERADDEIWQRIAAHARGDDELDLTQCSTRFAERVDQQPETYRWSYARDFGESRPARGVDSRAARVARARPRSILDDDELAWLDGQLRGDVDHLLIGTSLPFLLAPGLHHLEAFSEAMANGAWGDRGAKRGEKLRQAVDLEHWARLPGRLPEVAEMVVEVAAGQRGRAPGTITFLSGDVHHCYVTEAGPTDARAGGSSRILQAVCSPIRNPLPRQLRFLVAVLPTAWLARLGTSRGPLGEGARRAATGGS